MAESHVWSGPLEGTEGRVWIIEIRNREDRRNAIDREVAKELVAAFTKFEQDSLSRVGVLCSTGPTFCAGADLKALKEDGSNTNDLTLDGNAPLGPSRMFLTKPLIAAVQGHAVAGGLELSLMADLRIAEEDAVFGVFCRRWGVPLIDGGTVRLPRMIGMSRALDMILTGRGVSADEALQFGLANRVVPKGKAKEEAIRLATEISRHPWMCLRHDRLSCHEQVSLPFNIAMQNELLHGLQSIPQISEGINAFQRGEGRHGSARL